MPFGERRSQKVWNRSTATQRPHGVILDLGGGYAPLSSLVNCQDFDYLVIDKNFTVLRASKNRVACVCADINRIPIQGGRIAVALTITCLQYVQHEPFFAEAHRVLQPGGILATHENGACNPFILLARMAQRIIGLVRPGDWAYRNSIVQYYRHGHHPAGFEVVYYQASCLLSALLHCLEVIGVHLPQGVYSTLERVDRNMLRRMPFLRLFAFLHVKHFRKL